MYGMYVQFECMICMSDMHAWYGLVWYGAEQYDMVWYACMYALWCYLCYVLSGYAMLCECYIHVTYTLCIHYVYVLQKVSTKYAHSMYMLCICHVWYACWLCVIGVLRNECCVCYVLLCDVMLVCRSGPYAATGIESWKHIFGIFRHIRGPKIVYAPQTLNTAMAANECWWESSQSHQKTPQPTATQFQTRTAQSVAGLSVDIVLKKHCHSWVVVVCWAFAGCLSLL